MYDLLKWTACIALQLRPILYSVTFAEARKQLQSAVDARLSEIASSLSPTSLSDPVAYILMAGGKRVRPIMTMLAAGAVGGTWQVALGPAVAIELLHNFTLVHDDIMDRATTRRGRPTVHSKWDEGTALLVGDVLIGLAQQALISNPDTDVRAVLKAFANGHIGVCEGQALDHEFESRECVTIDEYIAMITLKTAKLLELSAELGAISGGASPAEVAALKSFALHLGIAFQIKDDLLDIEADEIEFGKTIGGDVVEGKRTCLFVLADMRADRESDRTLIDEFKRRRGLPMERIGEMRDLYQRLGVLDEASELIGEHTSRSEQELRHLPESDALPLLDEFAQMLMTRTR